MEFLTVVHRANIGLLRLTAYSISHSEYASVPWLVCVQDQSIELVRSALAEWPHIRIEDHRSQYNYHGGWQAQQMIKLAQCQSSSAEWTAIIGPGNILLGDRVFFDSSQQPYIQLDPNPDRFHKEWAWALRSRGITDSIPRPSVLTPWVWSGAVVRAALDHCGPLDLWTSWATTEQYFYWAWAQGSVEYRPGQLISGIPYLLPNRDWNLARRLFDSGEVKLRPWWLLHRTAYQGDRAAVRFTLDLMESHWRISPVESAEFWRDYLQGRWH
jgi:hypothetical protein